ncbi:NF-X1-type zinc finger protein NFXL1-like protein [Corchorus capsularis]|uniref:NF-X1-type zinc finger protein NFXL1-like protein n=1 Tax=Corchorus capsularis TaxID=210143 RepID=A0A1R3GH41_COCAP|nr:NF-X1-type zinc finger protein NFXL1-like protein [Corchorus capsularis]
MSFQGRNRARNSSQSNRQEWVPRGSPSTTTTEVSSSPATSDPTPTPNVKPTAAPRNENRSRQFGRSMNYRRDREKERSENHVVVRKEIDPNLPQLVQEIQDKLIKSTVECMICYDMVRSVILVHALLVRHLLHQDCVLVGKKLSPLDVLIESLFLLAVSAVISFLSVGAIGVSGYAIWDLVILARF